MSDEATTIVSTAPAPIGVAGLELESGLAPEGQRDSWTVIASSMAIGTASLMILGVQPLLLGALAQEGRVDEASLGRLATVEVLALAIGSAVGAHYLSRGKIAAKVAAGAILLALLDAAIYVSHSTVMLFLTRGAAGFIEGFILGAAIVVITHSRNPDRLNGLFLALQTIPQALLAYIFPAFLLARIGADGGFLILAAMAAISALTAFALTERRPPPVAEAHKGGKVYTWPVIGVLVAVTLQNAAIGGSWDYAERIASQFHISPDVVGTALAVSLLAQVAGAFAVAGFAFRLPFRIVTIAGPLCQAVVILLIATAASTSAYFIATAMFGLFWLALNPFQVVLLIDMEPSRRAVMIGTAITIFGLSVGPFLSSFGVTTGDVRGAFFIAAGLTTAAAVVFAISIIAHYSGRARSVSPAP
jgi:DHA1 family inner membrane transport protein